METIELKATHMQHFFELLKRKKKQKKNKDGEHALLQSAYVHKVMRHIKTYVRRLANKSYLKDLTPLEVPNLKLPQRYPQYLTKNEVGIILQHLEENVTAAQKGNGKQMLYAAYLWRAMIRFLYTTGLRNFEIRKLTLTDLRLEKLSGAVLGK